MEASLEEFSALAYRWTPFFRSALKVAIALRKADGDWCLRYSLTVFSAENMNAVPINIETRSIRAVRELQILDNESAPKIVQETLAQPGSISLSAWNAGLVQSDDKLSLHYERMFPQRLAGPKRLPTLIAQPHDNRTPTFANLSMLDLELLANPIPFETFAELLAELFIPLDANDIVFRPRTEIILGPPVWIDPSTQMKSGQLTLTLGAHPRVDQSKILLSFRAFPKDSPSIRRGRLTKDGMEKISVKKPGEIVYSIPSKDIPLAMAILTFDGEFVGKWWLRDETLSFNSRLEAHRAVDSGDIFRKTFFDERREFEDRVGLLLELFGLVTLKYGQIDRLTDAPDILALSPENHVYVVECTTGDINNKGKLQKLGDRAKAISDFFTRSRHPVTAVQPLIFTSLPRRETAAHWGIAANLRIGIICREEIATMLGRLESPYSVKDLHAAAMASIPDMTGQAPDTGDDTIT